MDFLTGSVVLKAVSYYVENIDDAMKDLADTLEDADEKSRAVAVYGILAGEALDGLRGQIMKKGGRVGWGSDEHKENWEPDIKIRG